MKIKSSNLKFLAFAALAAGVFTLKNTNTYADLDYTVKAGVEQTTFLTESVNESRSDQYTDFSGTLRLIDRRNESVFKLDGHLHQNLNGAGDNVVAIPEFFYSWFLSDEQTITAGRKIHSWNKGDELWGLGYFQPAMRLDSINPQMMGLTGFWWEASAQNFRFTALVSPFFLPDQGPNIREEDGQLVSTNPWFDSPVSQLRLSSLESDIRYKINWPQPEEIFNNGTYVAQFRWGLLKEYEDGGYTSFTLADKPINQLTLGLNAAQKLGLGQQYTSVEITPLVTRHQLISGEVGAQYGRMNFFIGGVSDNPYDIPEGILVNTPNQSQAVFIGAEAMIDTFGVRSQHMFSAIRIVETMEEKVLTEEEVDLGVNLDEFDRFQFTQALMWASSIRLGSASDQLGFRYIYSIAEEAGMLSLFLDTTMDRNLKASLSLDIIGSSLEEDSGFLSRHRENDRAQVSLSYVF